MARFDSLDEWLIWLEGYHPRSIDLGLERATNVFKTLNPSAIKPPTLIVAGTNGKGSCIAFLEAIYKSQGYHVGAYTSPHISNYNERIRIDGQPVSNKTICQAFERVDAARNDVSLSYFEFGTLTALDIFWRTGLDIQLLEVGLGGRLDAVNIIDADVSVITSICIDHKDWLGETREAIANEKAGIFRQGIPAVIGDINPPQSLLNAASEINTPLLRLNHEFSFQQTESKWNWHCNNNQQKSYLCLPSLALKGKHQYQNAATVLMAVTIMNKLLPVSEKSIHIGLKTTQLKGRFQLIDGDVPVLLDVAHNPQAVKALFDYLKENFTNKKIHAVFSMMKDKDIAEVIKIISPVIHHWFISPLSNPRTANESTMRDFFNQYALNNVTFGHKHFLDAFNAAKINAEKGDLILIFGSFFLVSEFFKIEN